MTPWLMFVSAVAAAWWFLKSPWKSAPIPVHEKALLVWGIFAAAYGTGDLLRRGWDAASLHLDVRRTLKKLKREATPPSSS